MFKTWNLRCLRYGRALSFGHLNFEDLEFVCGLRLENSTDFDIRISNLFSARKNTNLRTKELNGVSCASVIIQRWLLQESGLKGRSRLLTLPGPHKL